MLTWRSKMSEMIGNIEIGLYLDFSSLAPFLNIGLTLAFFKCFWVNTASNATVE